MVIQLLLSPMLFHFHKLLLKVFLRQAANDIISMLTKSPNLSIPTMEDGDKTRNAILKLAMLVNRVDDLPTLPKIHHHTTLMFVFPNQR